MNHKPKTWKRCWTVAIIVCLSIAAKLASSQTGADSAPGSLLRLVPDDAGVCFVLSDLKNTWTETAKSKWLAKLKSTNLAKMIFRDPELRKLTRLPIELEKILGVKWQRIRDDVLGDRVVLAYFPSTPSQSEEHGLVLARVRDVALFRRLIDRINEKQQAFGELKKLTTLEHEGVKFVHREEKNGNHYYWINGPIVAVSSQETLIRAVISRHKRGAKSAGTIESRLAKVNATESSAAVYVNPRFLESEFSQQLSRPTSPEKRIAELLLRYIAALQGVVVTVDVGEGVDLRLSLLADVEQLPESGKDFFSKSTQPPKAWAHFPDNAMLTVAGRIHVRDSFETFAQMLPAQERTVWLRQIEQFIGAAFHLDVEDDLLPNIGPDWGVCVFASSNKQMTPEFLAAVSLQPGANNVDEAIFRGLDRLAWLMVFQHNRSSKHRILIKSAKQDDAQLLFLQSEAMFPPGFRPTIALKNGFILFASSPGAVRKFRSRPAASATGEVPLANLSFSATHKWLTKNRKPITSFLISKSNSPRNIADQIVGGLLEGLSIFDRVTLTQRTGDGVASWRLRLR